MTKAQPDTIITTHAYADYDAIASMVAVRKLYPDAMLIAPSMQERQRTNEFSESIFYTFSFYQPREVDLSGVTTLVVVDTRQQSRIPQVSEVFANPDLVVHVYDHHPASSDDISALKSVIQPWGSTTAILVKLLQEKNISLSKDEATLLGLGLYEDTGSFTFSSTTAHDFMAGAWLRDQGMDFSTIAELTSKEDLTRDQLLVLNSLLESTCTHDINGISVAIAEVSLEAFLGDFSSIVQKMIDMENFKVLFALARMGDRVQVVARSSLAHVNVGRICSSLGGGGHSYAASASIKDKTLIEVKNAVLGLLASSVNPHIRVEEHMTSPAISIVETQPIRQADELMTRFGLKAVPVLAEESGVCVGFLEQQTAARAKAHGLGGQPVSDYMQRNVLTVAPEATLFPAMEIILSQRQRLVPVIKNEQVIGVLTRTDIIRLLMTDRSLRIPEGSPLDSLLPKRNVASHIKTRLPKEYVDLLHLAGELADEHGCSAYAVGGFVRDLLLYRTNLDIDISVEGDGMTFARALGEKLNGRVREHPKFKTAVVMFASTGGAKLRIDVATARLEYYESPGALPTVELSSINMDLFRRDFTINALAIQLNPDNFGLLVDPFGAQRDMKDKTINVLHSLSFIEDPTRILRGIRFEKRFDFKLGGQTERLVRNALQLGMFDKLSGQRLFNELKHVFEEKMAVESIQRMESFGLWALIHPVLKLTPKKLALLHEIESAFSWYEHMFPSKKLQDWLLYLSVLCLDAKYMQVSEVAGKFGFSERGRLDFLRMREAVRKILPQLENWRQESGPMSALHSLVGQLAPEGIVLLMGATPHEHTREALRRYLKKFYRKKADISGNDLMQLGGHPGPVYTWILEKVFDAKMDGQVKTKPEQLQLAQSLLAAAHAPQPEPE